MTDLALLDAVDQADLVRRGEVTATELVEAAISRIELLNPALNAVIFTSYEEALARAAARPSGRFAGVPYLLKNLVVERAGTPFTEVETDDSTTKSSAHGRPYRLAFATRCPRSP